MQHFTNSALIHTKAYINGQWCNALDGSNFPVYNPATGNIIAHVENMGATETKQAIEHAFAAQKSWRNYSAKERSRLLKAWHGLIMENQEDLARLITLEQGKPLAESMGEIAYGASYIEWFAEEAKRIYGDIIAPPSKDKRMLVTKEPVGVVACITPWNFPNAMLARKIAPALAAGCTVVCKPASETPLSALSLAYLAEQAGIPAGVINILAGNEIAIGAELTSNPKVRKLTFTGSTAVGKILQEQCAQTMKRTSMELGGNAPFIIFDDADLDAAIEGLISSKFRNSGQTCICANRIFVQQAIMDDFLVKITKRTQGLNVGDGMENHNHIGPLISKQAIEKVHALVQSAQKSGAKIALGGNILNEQQYFYAPTILTHVSADMEIAQAEIFGPVIAVIPFDTEEEVVAMANDTNVGLAAYFYSSNMARIWRVAENLEYGIVGINEGIVSNEMAPFGGMKESGNGREGSKYGLDDFLEIKYMCLGGI